MVSAALPFLALCALCAAHIPSRGYRVCEGCPVPKRYDHAMLIHKGRLTIVGGVSGASSRARSDLWTYDVLGGLWNENHLDWRERTTNWTLPCSDAVASARSEPPPRSQGNLLVAVSGMLLYGGGFCGSTHLEDAWLAGLDSGTFAKIEGTQAWEIIKWCQTPWVFLGTELWTVGGLEKAGDPASARSIVALVRLQKEFSAVDSTEGVGASSMSERYGHTSVLSGHTVLIFGGRDTKNAPLGDLWSFDLENHKFAELPSLRKLARYGHSATICRNAGPDKSDVMLIFGGATVIYDSEVLLSDVWAYVTGTKSWHMVSAKAISPERSNSAIACSPTGQAWIFGGRGSSGPLNDLWYLL